MIGGLPEVQIEWNPESRWNKARDLRDLRTCRAWPGGCEYGRDRSSSPRGSFSRREWKESSIEDRLQRLERTVQSLNDSVEKALQTIAQVSQREPSHREGLHREPPEEGPFQSQRDLLWRESSKRPPQRPPQRQTSPRHTSHLQTSQRGGGTQKRDSSNPTTAAESNKDSLYIAPSHSFSFLSDTSVNIEAVPGSLSEASRQNAYSELQYLSKSLTTARVDRHPSEDMNTFYVPSRAMGYRLLSQVLECSELAEPFFRMPSEDVIKQVLFEPESVQEKAWVVYINYLLLSNTSRDHDDSEEKVILRHNVKVALNDSNIFLEPREANVQMFALLAMHGEDYAAPNLSWMLLGHACRQAEALGFHFPAPQLSESLQEQRLCLFWLLFMIDKSCALAFGRPAFLPTTLYRDVPLPSDRSLLLFRPHDIAEPSKAPTVSHASHFGSQFLQRSFDLAKLMGAALEALATGAASPTKNRIGSKLDTWYLEANRGLSRTVDLVSASSKNTHVYEMRLGIDSLRFQYLHLRILLLKGSEPDSEQCLEFAREAIGILPSMVSNWSSVYNGVMWQLLYFPFTPFFVIFEHIIHHRGPLPALQRDLGLLAITMNYFADMQSQVCLLATVCSRLQHAAAAFLRLARVHVFQAETSNVANPSRLSITPQIDSETTDAAHCCTQTDNSPDPVNIGELDLATYLEWLPSDINMDSTWSLLGTEGQNPTTRPSAGGGRRAFDTTFDWFSWDAYYAGTQA
ncbi:hypothetical protein BO70DRAFT_419955 [Aspergillus heteromorphus CBS 117.55]|uniref:Xylanolytic transcriptional activator regulatory domain-containing protein n=1 Tax=Aspergillus heteromorphus CBS 117.55 TaxID=1448321 RepID=A0A317WP54_9EURO|nr:uncharacterized protein BO70DRAFT_419955 [Aspergillus heteromorphus CBS 117.55]PWY88274.1 hypothetical protein BO70DRAFT_419955 [Aspergillus heteromorphus CBS 117.55]